MDASQDRAADHDRRVAEIRRDIEAIRFRIAAATAALAYKADVPSRLADTLSSAASTFTARFLRRAPRADRTTAPEPVTVPEPAEPAEPVGPASAPGHFEGI